jgi:hypothetical protein
MKTYFIELAISLVREDPGFPDRDDRHYFEHLRYFCSKFFPLPAIDVILADRKFIVTRGHKYFRAASDLGYPWLRAVYQSETRYPQALLRQLPDGIRITPHEVLERESATTVARDFHVYFFQGSLTEAEKYQFRSEIAGFFERLATPLIATKEKRLFSCAFPFGGQCAEFKALIPIGDSTRLTDYLRTCQRFSRDVRRIVSFQGARFPEQE